MDEMRNKALTLAAMNGGYTAFKHAKGYLTGQMHFVVNTPRGCCYGDTALDALAAAAEVLGLEPDPALTQQVAQPGMVSIPVDVAAKSLPLVQSMVDKLAKPPKLTTNDCGADEERQARKEAWTQLAAALKEAATAPPIQAQPGMVMVSEAHLKELLGVNDRAADEYDPGGEPENTPELVRELRSAMVGLEVLIYGAPDMEPADAPAQTAKGQTHGPFTKDQVLLWFPREDNSRHERVTVAEDFSGSDDFYARVKVIRAGDKHPTSVRCSHLLTPEAWAELRKSPSQ